jgi:predicted acetyltransferase
MTRLVRPDPACARAWSAMMADFGGWKEAHGSGYWVFDEPPPFAAEDCAAFVAGILAAEPADPDDLGAARPSGRVANSHFWIADGDDLVGFLHLRHALNDFLLEEVGHIGYSVRPSRRREGHASRALALGVVEAVRLGVERVLVTCDTDNLASAATIERNGGVLEDVRHGKRRYWITPP